MKSLKISYDLRCQIEDRLEEVKEDETYGYEFIDVCQGVADEFNLSASIVEHIYDDMYVNNNQEWDTEEDDDEDEE